MEQRQDPASTSQNINQTSKRNKAVPPRISLPSQPPQEEEQTLSGPQLLSLPSRPIPAVRPAPFAPQTPSLPGHPMPSINSALLAPPFFSLPSRHMPAIGPLISGPQPLSLPSRPIPAVRPAPFAPQTPALPGLPSTPEPSLDMQTTAPTRLQDIEAATNAAAGSQQSSQTAGQASSSATRKQANIFTTLGRKLRRVPEMSQMSAVECGAACLAMVLSYYGRETSISEVQEYCGVGRDGLTALTIVKGAQHYGMQVRALSLKRNNFRRIALPAIIHWEFNHFVVLERWSPKKVDIVDPAAGQRRLTAAEFEAGFTGVVIALEPGEQFERRKLQRTFSLWSYMRSLLTMRGVIAQIIGTSLLLQILGIGLPLLTEVVVDRIIPLQAFNLLTLLSLGMLFLVLTQGITSLLRAFLLTHLQTRIDARMMLNFIEHMLSLPYRFFQLRLNGDLLSRVNSNTAIRDLLTGQLISTLLDGTTILVYLAVLISQSRLIAGVTVAIGTLQVILLLCTAPLIRRLTQRDLVAQGKSQGYLNEVLAGIATLKAAGAEQRALHHWKNLFFDEMNIAVRRSYLVSVVGICLQLVQTMSSLILLWIGAMLVIQGTMPVGAMLALSTLAASFLTPLGSLAASGQSLQIARAHFERIADVIEAEPEQNPQQVALPPRLSGHIELRHVQFKYDANGEAVLKDINVNIKPGQKVALVGKTGSGKSTLGKLLVGLITPTGGSILYDGIPLDQLNYGEVRKQFGVVLQDTFLFSGSVRDNIAFNNPDMSMEQVISAAKAAAIHEDIERMPMGYEMLVSEGGSVFSGGQRQRLALARALANQPTLLLLDEATSALDVSTEHVVEQNLDKLSCTQVLIAHRLSTIRNADLILFLDQGCIVEQGKHEQLLRHNGFYAQLIQTQLENGEIEAA
ncbi:peptidase domain-containing ABC transporter [Ktedonosporobacter rubrisoli]|nr:peptidase domain-containing ABC transporter [Ktedonosporobacter rubrisoli]